MVKYRVELLGLSHELGDLREAEVELDHEGTLGDLLAALRKEIPALEGVAVLPGEDRLAARYSFNVNGRFHAEDYDLAVRPNDHIVLLALALGG